MNKWTNKIKYLKAQDRINKVCEYLFAYNNKLNENPGIYILSRVNKTRQDGGVSKFAYIGQSVNVILRISQHMVQFSQRIDISLKQRGLYYAKSNPYGWKIDVYYCNEEELNDKEREFIALAQEKGYELYNITSGGQDEGKEDINERSKGKGYRDGLSQGYKNCLKDIKEYFDKYLTIDFKGEYKKKDGSVKEIYLRKYNEFKELMQNGERAEDNNIVDQESN